MGEQIINLKKAVEELLDDAKNIFVIEGDADGLWFVIKNVPYGMRHTVRFSDIMVKFLNNIPVVLVPTRSKLGSGKDVCDCFVQKYEFLKGWRAICPKAITYHGEDIFELIHRIKELAGDPELCDRNDCDRKLRIREDLPTLFDCEELVQE